MGLIDLEFASSTGDPALEFGWLMGHYIHWGLGSASSKDRALAAGQDLIEAYKAACRHDWPGLKGRVTAFAGACLAVEFARVDLGGTLIRCGLQEELAPEKALREILAP